MIDKNAAGKAYTSILRGFFKQGEKEAFFAVSELGKELLLSLAGPDVLIDIHATALKEVIKDADPMTITRMVVNANELLLNGIMGYAMTYYGFQEQLATEKRNLEEARATADLERDKLDDIVSAIDADLLMLDQDMRIVWANRRLGERFQRAEGKILGQYCYKAYCNFPDLPEDCPARQAFKTKKSVWREHPITHLDGAVRHYRFTCSPILSRENDVTHVLELVQDITDRYAWDETLKKKTVELEDKNRELEKFNKLFVDRELRMVELKKRIGTLEKELEEEG